MSLNGDYRTILKRELARRCQANPKYSQRAFARDLRLPAPRLNQVLSGTYGLSRAAAQTIAARIGLSREETNHFADLVSSQHGRSQAERQQARTRLQQRQAFPEAQRLQLDAFEIISDWYHFAILELAGTQGFISDSRWIASRLGIAKPQVELALERMTRLGLVEITKGSIRPTADFTMSPDGVPSEAIRTFHRQILEKALSALQTQSTTDERDSTAVTLAFNSQNIKKAKESLRRLRRKFCQEVRDSGSNDSVYCLSIHFFNLTPNHQTGALTK